MKSNNNPLSRRDNLVIQELDGEVLIYDLSDNKAFCLNETSALIWQACDGTKSAAEISNIISEKLNSPANEDFVWFAIDQLKKENLVKNSDQLPNNFAGMSRREVIKKVGLGTMIALPIISSMVTPASAAAVRSCTNPGQFFSTSSPAITNCGSAPTAVCTAAAVTQCCNGTSSGFTNCNNTTNTVDCTCA
jgi:hypothetical protein